MGVGLARCPLLVGRHSGRLAAIPTGALLMALELLPFEARRLQESFDESIEEGPTVRFTADVARGVWTLREVLGERGVA